MKARSHSCLQLDAFAIGKLGLIVGPPDEGNGQLLSFFCAAITTGGNWPMDEGRAPQGSVVLFSDEDDAEDTLAPRLEAAGADRSRVHHQVVRTNRGAPVQPGH